nr:hypothetical protein [Mesorhizobium ciceri]
MPVDPNHATFPAPSGDTTIWRYSSLPKLLSLLVTKELFLPSLRCLRRDDPFEGTPTLMNRRLAAALADDTFAENYFRSNYPNTKSLNPGFRDHFYHLAGGQLSQLGGHMFRKLLARSQTGICRPVETLCRDAGGCGHQKLSKQSL